MESLGLKRCVIFSDSSNVIDEAARRGLATCDIDFERLATSSLATLPRHLFPLYTVLVVQFLKARGTLRKYRPRAVIFAEAASSHEEILARAAQSLRITTVRIQHGRAGILSPGYYDMPYDSMLMWGRGFIERLKPISPACRYYVTGSPMVDRKVNIDKRGGGIRFPVAAPIVTFISQPVCPNITGEDYDAVVWIAEQLLVRQTELNVFIRLHPADNGKGFHRLGDSWGNRVMVSRAPDCPLETVLFSSTLVVGLYSTVLSESAAFGTLPVVLRFGDRHNVFPSPEECGAAALATSPADAVSLILELVADSERRLSYRRAMEAFAEEYFGPMDGHSLERIITHIENVGQ
jgi:hypothetical protein